jgi:hypothetical protein
MDGKLTAGDNISDLGIFDESHDNNVRGAKTEVFYDDAGKP